MCAFPGVVGPLDAQEGDLQDEDVYMNGTLSSPECGIVLGLNGTTTHIEEHYAKAINYTLMVTAVSFLQARLFLRPHQHVSRRMQSSSCCMTVARRRLCLGMHSSCVPSPISDCSVHAFCNSTFHRVKSHACGGHAAVDFGR